MIITLARTPRRKWKFEFVSENGRTIAESTNEFGRHKDATRTLHALIRHIKTGRYRMAGVIMPKLKLFRQTQNRKSMSRSSREKMAEKAFYSMVYQKLRDPTNDFVKEISKPTTEFLKAIGIGKPIKKLVWRKVYGKK